MEIKKLFDVLDNEKTIKEILFEFNGDEALFLYEGFADNMISFYSMLNEEAKDKLLKIIENKLKN